MKFSFFSSKLLVALTLTFFAFGCEKDEPATGGEAKGDFSVEMTDAPIDDAEVKAVFVTVADVRVDGQSLEGYSSTEVEISALTNGNTETLFAGQLAADSYSKLEVVLEECYYTTADNQQVALEVANNGVVTVQDAAFSVEENTAVKAVVDFDLRKALVRTADETKPYAFAAESRLNNSLRFVTRANSGTLTGKVTNDTDEQGDIVVYAYAKGEYSESEATGDSDDELFLNAVSSAAVNGNMEYTLAFLGAGDYELVAVAYEDTDQDGEVEMTNKFKLTAETSLGLDLSALSVTANSTTTANFSLSLLQ